MIFSVPLTGFGRSMSDIPKRLLFYSDINVIVGIKSVYIIAPYNSSPDRLFSIVIFLKSLDNETFAKEISSYIGVK